MNNHHNHKWFLGVKAMIWPFFLTAGAMVYHYSYALLKLSSLLGLGLLALVLLSLSPTVPIRHVVFFETSQVPVQRQIDQTEGRVEALDKRVSSIEALQLEVAIAKLQTSLDDQRYLVFGIGVVVLLTGIEKLFTFLTPPVTNRRRSGAAVDRREILETEEE
jgi:hypothetical protein